MISPQGLDDQAAGLVKGISAPVKGLNTQSTVAGLGQDFAMQLDNWVCQPDSLVTRTGCSNHKTGFSQAPKTLFKYTSGIAQELYAAADNGIFSVGTAGAVGAAVAACTNGWGKSVNFATSAGQFSYFVNGVDTPKLYNGSTWTEITGVSSPAITGPTTTTFKDVETYRSRLYFLQNDFLGFYYLPADSVSGAATAFRVGALCRQGGEVTGHATWTLDGGTGQDDHYVLATSEGEIIVFRGNDPGNTSAWTYVGTYPVGRPLGANCFVKLGGELLYLCEGGLIPLSSILQGGVRNYAQALSSRIEPSLVQAGLAYGTLPGWKLLVVPNLSLLMLNIPKDVSNSMQYCYNTKSKGWSTFSGWHAHDLIEYKGSVYFTTDTAVVRAFVGTTDYGAAITAICDTAYNSFGTRNQLTPLMMRALYASNSQVFYTLGLAQDFTGEFTESTYGGIAGVAGLWDSGLWDTALWGGSFTLSKDWVTVAARGALALSTRFKVSSLSATTVLIALDYKFAEQGLLS